MSESAPPPADGAAAHCSRASCRAPATWALRWNNPALHTPERRKTWLACGEHLDYLRTFLDRRGFLREVADFPPPHGAG